MQSLLSLLDRPGITMVTSTRRLARVLLERYGDQQARHGISVWRTPRILQWDDWTVDAWSNVVLSPVRYGARAVLNESQEILLFERAIEACIADHVDAALVPVPATARAARDAWNLAHDWRLPYAELARSDEPDSAMFQQWVEWLIRVLKEDEWITQAQLPMALTEAVSEGAWKPPGAVAVLGFDELPPARRALLEELRRAAVDVICPEPVARRGAAYTVGLTDRQAELRTAARWARELLASGVEAPIGIVVPDLTLTRAAVERVLRQTLHPESAVAELERAPLYHISLGRKLRDYPLVHCALSVLRWCQESISVDEASQVLHSPFVAAGETQLAERAALALRLRDWGFDRIELADLTRHFERRGDSGGFDRAVAEAHAAAPRSGERASAVYWAERFALILESFGWPGGCSLDSAEQQTREAWHDCLSRLASLGALSPMMNAGDALRRLTQLVTVRVFQPRAVTAPIQVLGVAEAAGLEFSHLWILGMSDDVWPPPPRPNAFLPLSLQQRCSIPAATASRQLAYSETVSRRLLASADEVVVSYGRRSGEQILWLSPLFAELPPWLGAAAGGEFQPFAAVVQSAAAPLDEIVDDYGPPVARGAAVRGGASLLRDQAACPFRAFARYRLRARAIPELEPGLDAAERGTLVHACLAGLWRTLGGSDGLETRSPADLRALVQAHVAAALARALAAQHGTFLSAFGEIEHTRLVALLTEWLELERGRPPFTVIETESSATLELSGLSLKLKIDRLDDYDDGRRLLIDYKTASKGTTDLWFGARPEEPQLPAYFLAMQAPTALAFARVRRGECAFIGAADGDPPAAGVRPADEVIAAEHGISWDALFEHWTQVLGALAAGFARGQAAVDPKDQNSCRFCDIGPLCRVFETTSRVLEE